MYSYDIMLEQMWNKPCISDVTPPPSTPDISPDYNPGMNLSYPPFPECISCAVVCMLISRLFNVIYSQLPYVKTEINMQTSTDCN